jgi:hypothetical protein
MAEKAAKACEPAAGIQIVGYTSELQVAVHTMPLQTRVHIPRGGARGVKVRRCVRWGGVSLALTGEAAVRGVCMCRCRRLSR